MPKKPINWGALFAPFFEKLLISLIVKSAGFKAWLIKVLISQALDRVVIPLFNLAVREGKLAVRVRRGRIAIVELEKAKEEGDEDLYNSLIDDA